jgi:hypothetical protein
LASAEFFVAYAVYFRDVGQLRYGFVAFAFAFGECGASLR